MKRVTFNDFSGGIAADGVILNDRQVADAHGFVLDDQRRLRSQPPIDMVGNQVNGDITKFVTGKNTWLIVRGETSLAYLKLTSGALDSQVPFTALLSVTAKHRVVGQIRYNDNNTIKPALLVHVPPQEGTLTSEKAYYITEAADGLSLVATEIANFYPNLTLRDNEYFAESSAIPRCGVVAMWRDIPVYANVEFPGVQSNDWYKDGNFSATTAKAYGNYLYFGHAFNNGYIDPRYPHRVSDDGTQIIGMYEVDEGLLCFTTGTTNASGVILLRGTPADFTVDAVSSAVNERITGLVPRQQDENKLGRAHKAISYWDEQQSVLYITEDGRLMQYRTGRLADISPQTNASPVIRGSKWTSGSSVAAAGRYLVYSDSQQRAVWIMRSYGTEGAWTRLVMPNGEPFYGSFIEAGGNVFWLHVTGLSGTPGFGGEVEPMPQADRIYVAVLRLEDSELNEWQNPESALMPGVLAQRVGYPSRRGEVLGAPATLRLVTRAVGEDSSNVEKWWDKIAVRVMRASTSPGTVVSVTTTVQDADQNVVAYTETVNDEITRPAETVVVNSAGPAAVAQFAVEVTGDIIVESIAVEFNPGTETF